jgi:putative peptidoglycan lipid II flippase
MDDGLRESGLDAASVNHSVGRLSALSFAASASDRVLGVALIALVAAVYGATSESDTYFLALVVPVAVGGALAEALYTALLPRFTSTVQGRPSLSHVVRLSASISLALMTAFVVVVVAAWPAQLGVWLILASVIPSLAVAGACAAVLVARRRYVAAVARLPIATGLALVVTSFVLPFEKSPIVLATGMAAGYLGALCVLLVAARRHLPPGSGGTGSLPRAAIARASSSVFIAVLIGGPLVVIVERALAAGLPAGSIALLTYARNLALVPLMISNALASGMFPAATVRHESADPVALRRLVVSTFRVALLASLCIGALIVIARRDLVRVALERGAFTPADARDVAELVLLFAGAIVGLTLSTVAARGLFALGRYRLVAVLSSLSIALYVILAVVLRAEYGREGLAVAFLISALAGGTVAASYAVRELDIPLRRFGYEGILTPVMLAATFATGAYLGTRLIPVEDPSLGLSVARLVVSAAAGLLALGCALRLVRNDDYRLAMRTIDRLRRS